MHPECLQLLLLLLLLALLPVLLPTLLLTSTAAVAKAPRESMVRSLNFEKKYYNYVSCA